MLAYDALIKETYHNGNDRHEKVRMLGDIQSDLVRDVTNAVGRETVAGKDREARRVINALYRGETVEHGWTTYTPA